MSAAQKGRKRAGGERPVYSFVTAAFPMTKLCMVLSTIEREWSKIVGGTLAARSYPKAFEDGVLSVSVENQAVLQDMNFKKNAVMREIRAKAFLPVREIHVEIGRFRRDSTPPLKPSPQRKKKRMAEIDPALEEKLSAEILSTYADMNPDLAKSIARCRIMCAIANGRAKRKTAESRPADPFY